MLTGISAESTNNHDRSKLKRELTQSFWLAAMSAENICLEAETRVRAVIADLWERSILVSVFMRLDCNK